jgi:dihydropteroate synthase
MIFWPRTRFEWRLRTRILLLGESTRIMAIVNLTPPSSAGPALQDAAWAKVAVAGAVEAIDAGADIVDLVAEPVRTHAVSADQDHNQEQARLLPVLEALLRARPDAVVAVDVHSAATARAAARVGAEIVNDLSANGSGWDDTVAEVVAQTGCGLVLRHSRGRSREWLAEGPMSGDEIVPELFSGLCERIMLAESAGIDAERLVADPGFGFGRRAAEDVALLAGLGRLRQLGRPLLLGLQPAGFSRQGASKEPANPHPTDSSQSEDAHRTAAIAGHVAAILAGVHILRVHDVQAAREASAVADAVLEAGARNND